VVAGTDAVANFATWGLPHFSDSQKLVDFGDAQPFSTRNPPFFDSHHFSAPALRATVFRVRDDDARRKGAAPWRLGSGRDLPI